MDKEEYGEIKDISIGFAAWLSENTTDYSNAYRHLDATGELMHLNELFDYYIHEILTEIELDMLLSKK